LASADPPSHAAFSYRDRHWLPASEPAKPSVTRFNVQLRSFKTSRAATSSAAETEIDVMSVMSVVQ
jgi:hypothetical protein